jgi:hypothetical protein
MAQSYADACDRIMAICQGETWIVQASNDPPGAAVQFPFAAIFPGTGTSKLAGGYRVDIHTVNLEIHWAFIDLPRNTGDAKDHIEELIDAIWADETLSAKVATIITIEYDFGPMRWGALETLGYVVKVTFKINAAQS